MMSFMKKALAVAVIAVTIAVPQLAAQRNVAARYVDRDGFAYSTSDSGYLCRWIEDVYNVASSKVMAQPDFAVFDTIIREVWKECKAAQLGASAASGKEIAPDFFAIKQFTEISAAHRTSFLWNLCKDTQVVPFVDVMPKNTLVGFGVNFDGSVLVAMVDHYIGKYGNQEIKDGYAQGLRSAMQEGVDLKKLVNSINGIAFYLEADPARQVMPGFSSAALILSVKDRSIMDLILMIARNKNPNIVTANNELLIPTEFGNVAVFQSGNFIVATTDPNNAKNVIARRAASLRANPDFIRYSAQTPSYGNSFAFISSELGKSVMPAYIGMLPPDITRYIDVAATCKVVGIGPAVYCVGYSNRDGCGYVCNTGSKGLALISTNAVLSSALSSSIMMVITEILSDSGSSSDFNNVQ